MFEWKVEDMVLRNQKNGVFMRGGKEKVYTCESKVSREDKIAFVDEKQDGKLSYIMDLIKKFNEDKESLPKDQYGNVKTVSFKAWTKRNDTKYPLPMINYRYGNYRILGMERYITYERMGNYDIYEDIVDEVFHRQLKECEKEENKYFLEHDEYSILKEKVKDWFGAYHTTFGVPIIGCSDGAMYVSADDNDFENKREITIEELKELLAKYEQLDKLVEKLTAETHIVY